MRRRHHALDSALGVILGRPTSLYQLPEQLLTDICYVYRAGEPEARDPRELEAEAAAAAAAQPAADTAEGGEE